MEKTKGSPKYPTLLFIIIFLLSVNNFIWLKNNKVAPVGNGLQDLFPGINFYLDLIHNDITFKGLLKGIFIEPLNFIIRPISANVDSYFRLYFFIYPPLVPLSYSLFYFLFGPNTRMELMVNVLYLAIAMISIYGIGKKIFNAKVGLLAAFIFSSFPGVISSSRTLHSEFNLMCMIALTTFFLLQTDFFINRKYSLLLGLSLGLTALTKWEFPITMIGSFLWYISQCQFFATHKAEDPFPNSYIRINFFLSILIAILVSFFWYAVSVQDILWRVFFGSSNIVLGKASVKLPLIQKFSFYPLTIINTFISFFYFLLFILAGISFTYWIIKNRNRQSQVKDKLFYALFLVLWIVIPYPILSLSLHAFSHIMPVLPAIAILISLGIFSFKNIIVRSVLIFLIMLYGLGGYLHSFVYPEKLDVLYRLKLYLSPDLRFSLTTITDNIPRDAEERWFFYPPDTRDWKIEEILTFIKEDSLSMKPQPLILILGPQHRFSCFAFQYHKLLKGYQLFIEPRGNDRSPSPPDPSKFDYVVVNPLDEGLMDETVLSKTIKLTLNISEEHKIGEFKKTFFNRYKLIKEYILPDNTEAKIYKLTNS